MRFYVVWCARVSGNTRDKMNKIRRRRKRLIRTGIAVTVFAVILIVIFLFRVQKIMVYGNARHSQAEISEGLLHDVIGKNTLHLMWKYRNGTVPDTLPFLDSLTVQMDSPFQVTVTVTEKELVGYVDKGEAVYFDKNGTVLEMTDQIYEHIPIITGASIGEPVLYQKLPTESGAQLRTILSLLQLLSYHEIDVEEIRFGDNMEMTVFSGGIEAQLGQDEYLEEKIANMKSIFERMSEGERGVLHLESFTGGTVNIPFTPSDEPVTEAQDETEADTHEGGADGSGEDGAEDIGADGEGGTGANGEGEAGANGEDGAGEPDADQNDAGGQPFMAFDSSGTLRYDVRVVNGEAVDGSGNPVPGCTVNEDGYVVDAYWNVIDPATGQPIQ